MFAYLLPVEWEMEDAGPVEQKISQKVLKILP